MILNNYKTMKKVQEYYKNEPLSIEMIKELHKLLTDNDINIPKAKQGIFRTDKDDIVVGGSLTQYNYKTPNTDFLENELKNLIDFSNNTNENPIIKAIMLHFWFAYLHPFVDGNGRLARCLFYWYLVKNNLDIFIYYPISTILKKSAGQYAKSYLYAEQDDNDLTYFIDYNLNKIVEAKNIF